MTLTKGKIFNIQKFSITDGEGIRTLVFMKGCPLRCLWCSNPESQRTAPEIMDVKSNCTGCGKCVNVCPEGCIDPVSFDIDREKCKVCGACTRFCYANAKKLTGEEYTVVEIIKKIEKDRVFYLNSSGGITVGGGEPLMQAEFVAQLMEACQMYNIHTAIETSGYGQWEKVKPVFEHTDQIFFDLKAGTPQLHKKLTGVSNELIMENAKKLAELGKRIIFRVPLIPGLNDDPRELEIIADFVASLDCSGSDISVEVLPYHNFGRDKYRWLDMEYQVSSETRCESSNKEDAEAIFSQRGIRIEKN